jgi:cytochrome c553
MPAVLAGAALALLLPAAALGQDVRAIASQVCGACHGEDGNSSIPMFPKIAGQQESYLVKQLRDFQSGRRKSDVMGPVVAAIRAQDFSALAAFYSGQKTLSSPAADDRRTVAFGKLVFFDGNEETGVPACVGCHQPLGVGHQIYPRIGGQHAMYLKQQLKNFATAERNNDANRFMRVIAKRMNDEEIEAVAAYLAGLEGR